MKTSIKTSIKTRNTILLLLAAFIWGTAFVAQRKGAESIGPFTFLCIRSFIGCIVLSPVIKFKESKEDGLSVRDKKQDKSMLMKAGIGCGLALFIASALQQVGIYYGTSAGKSGFLTACYILIVPILAIFLGKKCSWNIWCGVFLALVGLYFLCMVEALAFSFSDACVLACAFVYAVHILIVDKYTLLVDGVRLSRLQFLITGIFSGICMICFEILGNGKNLVEWVKALSTLNAWIPILYAGIFSSGVAFTLQIIGQKGVNPTVASLVMSMESVFSVIAGCIILNETLSIREALGCILIFAAIILAQIPVGQKKDF